MSWKPEDRADRFPDVQRGWEIIGAMVKRRRIALGWTQRDLQDATGFHQSSISRLERGILAGIRFSTFARIVSLMNGLDADRPPPPQHRPRWWD